MAEGDGAVYNCFKDLVMEGRYSLLTDTVKVILVTGHTPSIDDHTSYGQVSGNEESGTGYTAGGEALASKTCTQDNTNDRGAFDAANVTWTGLNVGTPSHAIMYDDTDSGKVLIAYWEVTTTTNGGDYTLQWNAAGIMLLT